jgi:hypothetical protein
MASMTRAQRREYHAKQRHLRKYRERLQHEQTRAQRFLQTLEQAMLDLGLPETLAAEVEWRLNAQAKLLGNIVGLMFPTVCGCRTTDELSRVRGWDKNLPSRLLGALPTRTWVRPWPHRGQISWPPCGIMWRTRARPPAVGGSGRGSAMTASSKIGPAAGADRDLVERPGAPGPAGDRWPALGGGDRGREAGHPGGRCGAPTGPGGAWAGAAATSSPGCR